MLETGTKNQPTSAPQTSPDLDATRITEIAAVVCEATNDQDAHFLDGLEYGLTLAGLMARPEIEQAWYAGVCNAIRR
jgi:hypothetical protein